MKQPKYTPAEEHAEEPIDKNEITDGGSDRRTHGDSKQRDRRVIARLTDPQLRLYARQIHRLCKWWVWASLAYVVVMVGEHLMTDFHTSQKSIFYGVVILILTFMVRGLSVAAASYVENESQARMEKLVESCYHMLFAMATASLILGGAYLITLF